MRAQDDISEEQNFGPGSPVPPRVIPEKPAFRPDLEGLRGAAILLVVAFHAGVPWLAGAYVGVDVFFVLSGFFITDLLARELLSGGTIDLGAFYARRARRLAPAFLVVLLATIAAVLVMYAPIDQGRILGDARSVALYAGNMHFAHGAIDYHATGDNPLLHTWSLAVEEQFYVIWPLVFLLIGWRYRETVTPRRLLIAVALAGTASLVLSLVLTQAAQPWAFFLMPTRIWEFAAGGALALALEPATEADRRSGVALQIVGIGALAVATAAFHGAMPYPGFAAILPVAGAVALLLGGHYAPTGPVTRALGAGLLRWFGRLSYSWYLWHWPLVGIGAVVDWQIGVTGRLAWSGMALVLAVLTYHLVEEPIRRRRALDWMPDRLNVAAVVASLVAALIAHGAMLAGNARASSPAQRPFLAARWDGMPHDCWGSMLEDATAPCEFGDRRSRTVVALMGDSHAEHWLPALDRIGRERHWKILAMVKPGCPVADVTFVNAHLKREYSECGRWRQSTLRRILAVRPDAVILSSYNGYVVRDGERSPWKVTAEQWGAGLHRTYSRLSVAGIPTIAMRDVPDPGFDVPACLSRRAARVPFQMRDCVYDLERASARPAIAAQTAAVRGLANVAVVDMNDRVCRAAVCGTVQRGVIVYRDDDHLTLAFSRAAAPVLGERLATAIARLASAR